MDLQDESIWDLASALCKMLGTANAVPDLPVIQNMTNIIEEISHQSLQVASLIHEYTKLLWAGDLIPFLLSSVKFNDGFFTVQTVKIQSGLKSRIEECQNSCTTLMVTLSHRINVDMNTWAKKIGQTVEAIKDDQLGTFKFLFSLIIKLIQFPSGKDSHVAIPVWHLQESQWSEWQMSTTPAPGFLVVSNSWSGK